MGDSEDEVKKPIVKLIGQNGNVFNVIGRTVKALEKAGLKEQAKKFMAETKKAGTYDGVLRLAMEYCEVE